jgi:galactokinase
MKAGEQRKRNSRIESVESLGLLLRTFGSGPRAQITRAPGRVNLIGEHTDYNGGYVLPFAIDRVTEVALRPRKDRRIRIFAEAFQETAELHLPIEDSTPTGGWQDYLTGILIGLSHRDDLPFGFDGAIMGNIPIGAGLSSSASLEVALALGLSQLYKIELGDLDLVTLCQRAENEFVGTHCGIMDQYASLLARENSALLLDTRSLKHRYVPLSLDNLTLLIVDSNVRRSLSKSGYNERRRECQEALRFLQEALPNHRIDSLSDLDSEGLNRVRQTMPQTLWERALHVQEENRRVLAAAQALEEGHTKTVGKLLFSSHASLRDLFCVSTPELDFLVDWAKAHGALGSRLVGGGFGGVTLHLIAEENSENYAQSIREAYQEEFSRKASVLEVHPGPGARACNP